MMKKIEAIAKSGVLSSQVNRTLRLALKSFDPDGVARPSKRRL